MELPSELIQAIVVKLPLKDVVTCMCICKKWKDVITTDSFWKNYTFHWFDFSLEEGPTGNLNEWQNDWFCYWDDTYGEPTNEHVFSTPPKRWKDSGIIHPASFDIKQNNIRSYRDFFKCLWILQKINKGAEEYELDCPAYGNEGSSRLEVCLFPWEKEKLPGNNDVGALFAFDEHMCSEDAAYGEEKDTEPLELETEEDDDQLCLGERITSFQTGNPAARSYLEWLQKLFVPSVMMCFGMEQMNPVPVFILTQLAPGWVGGFFTSVTCT